MKKEDFDEKIVSLLRGELTPKEATELVDLLSQTGFYSIDEINEMRKLYNDLDNELVPEPSPTMDEKFYEMLYSEKTINSSLKIPTAIRIFYENHKSSFRVAASITLFIIGWFGGIWFANNPRYNPNLIALQQDLQSTKEKVILSGMQMSSPFERIKAVNMTEGMNSIDNHVVEALIKTLNQDPNDNVRLVALEALRRYSNYPEVRKGLIESISKQTSPLIQLALADAMIDLQEKRALPYFEDILKNKELNYTVRKKIDETVKILI